MRDHVLEELRAELARRDAYEANVPICAICGQRMTNGEYFYDVNGTYVCDEVECVYGFMRPFRKNIEDFIKE